MDNFDFENTCFICSEGLQLHPITEVKKRGLNNFCSISAQRNDGFQTLLENLQSVKIHERCRLNYVNKKVTDKCKKKASSETSTSPVKKKLRQSDGFRWIDLCFICGEEADEEKELKRNISKRRTIRLVSSSDFKTGVMTMIENRRDDYSRDIHRRISAVPDLIAVNAKYHNDCYDKLRKLSGNK